MPQQIALISTNRKKFSETFIHSQIADLPYSICLYVDGYLPQSISYDRGISFQKLKSPLFQKHGPEKRLEHSFKKNKIKLVLAQYGPSGVEVMSICHKLNIPLIVHFHGYDAYRFDILNSYGKKYRELFEIAKKVIVVSKDMEAQLLNLGCPKDKIALIPYGVDIKKFKPKPTQAKSGFIFCGRFVEKKGLEYTLKAFKKLRVEFPGQKLKLIGDGPLKIELEEFIRVNKLNEHVVFYGILSPEKVAHELNKSLAYIQHSIKTEENDSEGTPLSILEAMSTGLPVIATNHGGIKDLIQDKEQGFLIAEKEVESMYQKMLFVIENQLIAKEMGEKGRLLVENEYSIERYIMDLSRLISACMD